MLFQVAVVFPTGTVSNQMTIPLPSGLPTPLHLAFQDLAIDQTTGAGNTSNAVENVIE